MQFRIQEVDFIISCMTSRKSTLNLCLVLCFIFTAGEVFGQFEYMRFDTYSVEEGLPNSRVNGIVEDNDGYIWIGTRGGLNRFDGYEFKTFTHHADDSTSLGTDDVSFLCNSKSGDIWVGTWGAGLNRLNPREEKFKRYDNSLHVGANSVRCISEDKNGIVWLGTFGGGLFKFDPESEKFTLVKYQSEEVEQNFKYIEQLKIRGDTLWVASLFGGLGYVPIHSEPVLNRKDFEQGSLGVSALTLIDNEKALLIANREGQVFKLDFASGEITEYEKVVTDNMPHKHIWEIFEDKQGNIWIGTSHGMLLYSPETGRCRTFKQNAKDRSALKSDNTFYFFQDSRNIIWVGTWYGGVSKYDQYRYKFKGLQFTEYPESKVVFAITPETDSTLWLGTLNGIFVADKNRNVLQPFIVQGPHAESINSNRVWFIKNDSSQLMVAAEHGIFQIDKNTGEALDLTSSVGDIPHYDQAEFRTMISTSDGNIWFGSWRKGIYRYHPSNGHLDVFMHNPDDPTTINSNSTFKFHEDRHGILWIGTKDGLDIFDNKTNTFKRFEPSNKEEYDLRRVAVRVIHEDEKGDLWLGTINGLYHIIRETGKLEHFNDKNGLADNVIYGMVAKGDRLWLSSNNGVMSFNMKTYRIVNYDGEDGLLSAEYCRGGYQKWGDEIFFGGENGVDFFVPEYLRSNPNIPPVYITKFLLHNEEVKPGEGSVLTQNIQSTKMIELDHDQKSFSFEFTALNFTSSVRNIYRYKLENFDKEWISCTSERRRASYTNLDPGEYVFRVQASNNDGVWNLEGVKLIIIVKPAFWQTAWFQILIAGTFMFLIYLYYRWRMHSIKRSNQELELVVKERTSEITIKNEEIESKRLELALQNKKFQDSIEYGLTIQKAILPSLIELKEQFADVGLLFKPRETVSGDFYWVQSVKDEKSGKKYFYIAVVDCTGHGVPGAFMSMIGSRVLTMLINEKKLREPSEILNELDLEIHEALKQKNTGNDDGMDLCLARIEELEAEKFEVTIGTAKRPFAYHTSASGFRTIKASRYSIGGMVRTEKVFEQHKLLLNKGDQLYLFTDGYYDQQDVYRKKLGRKAFYNMLQNTTKFSVRKQIDFLNEKLLMYKNNTDQRDDITILILKM